MKGYEFFDNYSSIVPKEKIVPGYLQDFRQLIHYYSRAIVQFEFSFFKDRGAAVELAESVLLSYERKSKGRL